MADPRSWRAALPGLGVLGLVALLCRRTVFGGEAFYERDLHLEFYPRFDGFARSVFEGAWPLWDRAIAFGQSRIGDPSAQVLYPPTWLNTLLLPWTYYTWFVAGHLAFSGWGLFLLGRALGTSTAAAFLASGVWVLSGPLLSLVNVHHLAAAAWVPWVLLAAHGAFARRSRWAAIGLGGASAAQVLGGSLDLATMTALLWAAYALRFAERRPVLGPANRRLLGLGGLAALMALAVSAGQWLPALEVASRSSRWSLPEEVRTGWSVPPLGLVRVVWPLPVGDLPLSPERRAAFFDHELPLQASLYLGLGALGLASAVFASERDRSLRRFLAGLAVAGVLLSLGRHAPFYDLLVGVIPPLRALRYPSKFMLFVALAVGVLAGMGLDAWRSRPVIARSRLAFSLLPALVVSVMTLSVALALAWQPERAGAFLLGTEVPGPAALQTTARGLLLGGAAGLLLSCAVLFSPGHREALLISLVLADLFMAHDALNRTTPPDMLRLRPPVVDVVADPERRRIYVYDYHSRRQNSRRHLGREYPYALPPTPPGWDRARTEALAQRLYLFPPLASQWGLEGSFDLDTRGLYPVLLRDLTDVFQAVEGTPAQVRLLRLGAVRFVVALHKEGFEGLELVRTLPSLFPEPIHVFEVKDPLPRAYVVGMARPAAGQETLGRLLERRFDPTREILVPDGADALPGTAGFRGECRTVEWKADRVRLEADLSGPGYLVLVDSFDPGWKATVDGVAAPVVPANAVFRAVRLPPGRHVVEQVYRPGSALAGFGLSMVALVAVLVWWMTARARRERWFGREG